MAKLDKVSVSSLAPRRAISIEMVLVSLDYEPFIICQRSDISYSESITGNDSALVSLSSSDYEIARSNQSLRDEFVKCALEVIALK
jgi:hypothetical protein